MIHDHCDLWCNGIVSCLNMATNHCRLLEHSGGQAMKTGSTGEGLHDPAGRVCGC